MTGIRPVLDRDYDEHRLIIKRVLDEDYITGQRSTKDLTHTEEQL